jgi:peptidyl-prolyl cis-trans isomerase A (cyclophilin A)
VAPVVGARGRSAAPTVAVAAALGVAACAHSSLLYDPTPALLETQAPDSFVVGIETSEGYVQVRMHRDWSPLAVDRAYQLMENDFYAGARFYRVIPGFVAQWGFSGDPALDSVWRDRGIQDEAVVASNLRGTVSFARAGPRTRSYTLFVNLDDNARLDSAVQNGVEGYPPIGVIESNVEVVDGFYSAYDVPGAIQDSIRILGNDYLRRTYPQMDSIIATRVIAEWR